MTTTGGLGGDGGGVTTTGVFAFSVRLLLAGTESACEYPIVAPKTSSPAAVTLVTTTMFPYGASDDSQSRLHRSVPAPLLAQPGPRSVVAETTDTPAGRVTSTITPVAGP